jgi:hypothetical protein
MEKKIRIRDGKKNPDSGQTSQIIFPRAQKQFFGLTKLKFFDADPDPG